METLTLVLQNTISMSTVLSIHMMEVQLLTLFMLSKKFQFKYQSLYTFQCQFLQKIVVEVPQLLLPPQSLTHNLIQNQLLNQIPSRHQLIPLRSLTHNLIQSQLLLTHLPQLLLKMSQ